MPPRRFRFGGKDTPPPGLLASCGAVVTGGGRGIGVAIAPAVAVAISNVRALATLAVGPAITRARGFCFSVIVPCLFATRRSLYTTGS